MRAQTHLLLVAALVAGGCIKTVGKGPEAFPVANSPAGVAAGVSVRSGGMIVGELLEVRDTALVLLRGTEVVLVPNVLILNVRFQGSNLRTQSVTPAEFVGSGLRLLARYPSGISPTVMAALLSASGRSEPTVAR
jgi:hypothetical protein